MSNKAKLTVAAVIAAISVGGLAPAASARTTIYTQVERIQYRLLDRGVNRLVGNVGENVERTSLGTGEAIERTLNPR